MPEEIEKMILDELRLIRSYLEALTMQGIQVHPPEPKFYTLEEAGKILSVSEKMMQFFTDPKKCEIPHSGIGARNKRISLEDLNKWYADNRTPSMRELRSEFVAESRARKGRKFASKTHKQSVVQPKDDKTQLAESYGKFISSYSWDIFAVFTTDYPLTVKYAFTLMNRFYKILSQAYKISCVFVAERFDGRDGYHIHCLIKYDVSLPFEELRKITNSVWQTVAGKRKKIATDENASEQKQKSGIDHNAYIAKYCKDKHGDFYLSHKIPFELNEYDFLGLNAFCPQAEVKLNTNQEETFSKSKNEKNGKRQKQ